MLNAIILFVRSFSSHKTQGQEPAEPKDGQVGGYQSSHEVKEGEDVLKDKENEEGTVSWDRDAEECNTRKNSGWYVFASLDAWWLI